MIVCAFFLSFNSLFYLYFSLSLCGRGWVYFHARTGWDIGFIENSHKYRSQSVSEHSGLLCVNVYWCRASEWASVNTCNRLWLQCSVCWLPWKRKRLSKNFYHIWKSMHADPMHTTLLLLWLSGATFGCVRLCVLVDVCKQQHWNTEIGKRRSEQARQQLDANGIRSLEFRL